MTSTVYVAGAVEDTVTLRAQAMALVVRPTRSCVIALRPGCGRIELYTYAELDDPVIETARSAATTPARGAGPLSGHTASDRRPDDFVTSRVSGSRPPSRTALDLACHC